MTTAFILFPPPYLKGDAWRLSAKPQLIAAYEDNRYNTGGTVEVGTLIGQDAAEECFDLTNNPRREIQRGLEWAGKRSVSVGDIIKVGDEAWLCASVGWTQIIKGA